MFQRTKEHHIYCFHKLGELSWLLSYYQTPTSRRLRDCAVHTQVTEWNFTIFCHIFGGEPDLRTGVKNGGSFPFMRSSTTAFKHHLKTFLFNLAYTSN